MARVMWLTAWLLFCGLSAAQGQLLYDSDDRYDSYKNYAWQGYRPYSSGVFGRTTRDQFDDLGNFVMDGVEVYRLDEGRTNAPLPGSLVSKSSYYTSYLNRLLVAQDSYGGWDSRLMIGDRIRTKFTSLTLDLVALNGARWDFDTGNTQMSFISSRQDWPIFNDADNVEHAVQDWASYLLGGHVQRSFGALDVSASYVNQHRTSSLLSWGDNSLQGILPARNNPPAWLAVKFSDGSDRDAHGARVFDVRLEGALADIRPVVTRHDADVVNSNYPNGDRYYGDALTIPPYVEFLRGDLIAEPADSREFFEAQDTQYLIYWFRIPQELRAQVERARFRALVDNDYLIEVSEVYLPVGTESSSNASVSGERATFFERVAGARGNPQDGANRRWVHFDYGRQTGRTTGSVRVELHRQGFSLTSEVARTYEYRQYPTLSGAGRWNRTAAGAWFINARKTWARWSVGGEWYRMAPRYATSLTLLDSRLRSYTDFLTSPFSVFPSFPGRYNDTLVLGTVDDNDDRDRFPDQHFLPAFADRDGIFPGLDLDQDGRPDPNENGNSAPDFLEPFLLYDSDPLEFDYGDDLNNNGIIDHREDDLDPDYPYDVDTKGHHLFVGVHPRRDLRVDVGFFDTRQIWGPGRSRMSYLRAAYDLALFPWGRIEARNFLKRVRDDIEDDSPQFVPLISNAVPLEARGSFNGVPEFALTQDELLMRNSLVNTAYVDATIFRVPNLNVNGRVKHTRNAQAGNSWQGANRIDEWAWVLRADYTWRYGDLVISPRAKLMQYSRRDQHDRLHRVSERFFYPILMSHYDLTQATRFSVGWQGLPALPATYRDQHNRDVDFDARDFVALMTNRTTYQGYNLTLSVGYSTKEIEFSRKWRAPENIDRGLFFMRLIMGLEPFKG